MDENQIILDKAAAVKEIFKDPRIARLALDAIIGNKPANYGRRSRTSYYNEKFGNHMKSVADTMIEFRTDQCFHFSDFPGLNPNTLYLRIWQGIKYLRDRMDTEEGKYKVWYSQTKTTREPNVGVLISWKEPFRDNMQVPFKPRAVKSPAETPMWKDEIDKFLSSKTKSQLHITGLSLTPEQLLELKSSFANTHGVICAFRSYEIKMIKTN